MGIFLPDSGEYYKYGHKVRTYWNDLLERVQKARGQGMPLPFSYDTFAHEYAEEVGMITVKLDPETNLYISDDDYQGFRASHTKEIAYNDAFEKAIPKELKPVIGSPPPDSTSIGKPPETLGSTIEDLGNTGKNAVGAAAEFGKLALAGVVVVGGMAWLAGRKKKGDK